MTQAFVPTATSRWSKKTAKAISSRLRWIRKQHGALTREIVVEDARDPNSPLHKHFDWDVESAAYKWLLHQAGEIMRRCRVTVTISGVQQPIREFPRVTIQDAPPAYTPIGVVKASSELSEQVIERAKADLDMWLARYEKYAEFYAPARIATQRVRAAVKALSQPVAAKKTKRKKAA